MEKGARHLVNVVKFRTEKLAGKIDHKVCAAAACGGAPHQSRTPFGGVLDSFSPRGEAFVPYWKRFVLFDDVEVTTKGFSLEGEAVIKIALSDFYD